MVPNVSRPLIVENLTLNYYIDMIQAHHPFTLARYGDGEMACMFGYSGQNCDDHDYTDRLGHDLRGTIRKGYLHERPFHYGLVRVAQKRTPKEVAIINEVYQVPWVDGTVLVDASRAGELYPFIEAIKQHRRVLYIGPPHLRSFFWQELGFWYLGRPGSGYHEIPQKNCYLKFNETLEHIASYIRLDKPSLVLFSAGMMSNVLIHRLWPEFGGSVTMIDVGSLFDGFAGKYSRKYMHDPKWQALREVNLYGHKHEKIDDAK